MLAVVNSTTFVECACPLGGVHGPGEKRFVCTQCTPDETVIDVLFPHIDVVYTEDMVACDLQTVHRLCYNTKSDANCSH